MATERRSAAEWRVLLDDWMASGLDADAFSASRGVNAATLKWWRWRLRAPDDTAPRVADPQSEMPGFLEVVVAAPEVTELVVEIGTLRVRVPYGFDAREVRRLVFALC